MPVQAFLLHGSSSCRPLKAQPKFQTSKCHAPPKLAAAIICNLKLKAVCTVVGGGNKLANTVSTSRGSCQKLQVLQKSRCVAVSSIPDWAFSRTASNLWRVNTVACLCRGLALAVPMRVVPLPPQPLLQHSEHLVTTKRNYCTYDMHLEITP